MPLRDHFRPPVSKRSSWEGFHGMWPASIVQHLQNWLPAGFIAEPLVRPEYWDDVDESFVVGAADESHSVSWQPPSPTVDIETELPDLDEYEVRIYDVTRGRHLVAAVEIVSPANKDRAEHRTAFVGKCAALLRQGVAVSIVDLVTVRQFNLYAELLESIGHADIDPTLTDPRPHLYAASCRWVRGDKRARLQAWSHALAVGDSLPTLPLWLTADRAVPLALEESYERACHDLWIT